MAKFEIAHRLTGISEGGYTGDEDDNGNWTGGKKNVGNLIGTKYGISAPVLMAHLGRVPTVLEMKNLSKYVAYIIYKKKYWDPIRGDEIHNQEIANQIYDMGVNAGVGTSIKMAKRSRNIVESTKMDDAFLSTLNQTA